MKQLVLQLQAHPTFAKTWHWVKLIAITGGAQGFIQLTGFLCGILVIRILPIEEYALYTLANTMLGTMVVISDSGISTGIMGHSGKVWKDKKKLGVVLATGLNLRIQLASLGLIITLPVLFYLLKTNGASWYSSIFIVLAIIPAFFSALSDTLLEIPPKLYQAYKPIQINQIMVGLGRVLMLPILLLFPFSFIAVIINSLPRIYGNYRLKKLTARYVDFKQNADKEIKKDILKTIYKVLPGSIYYCIQGQLTIFLVSIIGNSNSIAQIGALSRISVIFNMLTVIFHTLASPLIAKLPNDKGKLRNIYIVMLSALLLFSLVVVTLVYFFNDSILWILGKNYQGLSHELLLNIIVSCIALFPSFSIYFCSNRGWAINSLIAIGVNIFVVTFGIIFLDISSLIGIIKFNLIVAISQLLLFCSFTCIKINRV